MRRREFIAGLGSTAAWPLPAIAQENAERPRPGIGTADRRGSIAETLADYAVRLRYEDLPAEVVRTAKRTILDTVGCAIGGYHAGPSQIAIKLAGGVSAIPGATVGASRLMGLTPQQMVHAIGITVGGNTALNQGRVGTLSNWKDFASAEASRKAIFSAQLAQAGMTGPSRIFEGPSGFFNVISRKSFDLPKLGEPYGIMKAFTKRFPLGQYSQTVAEAAAQLRSFFANTDEIQEVNIRVSRNAIKVMADSPDKWRPQSHETADHSMPSAAAVVLLYGAIDDQHYEDPYLHDPRLLDLVSRVRCIPSAEADVHEKDYNLCDFEIVLKSGAQKSVRVEYHRGHPKNPMTDAEMEEKFRSLAVKYLPAERVDALLRQLWAPEDMPKAATLVEMTKV
jgi:2-methylcitrate dehydratase